MIQRCLLRVFLLFLAICSTMQADAVPTDHLVRLGDSAYIRHKYDSAVAYYKQAASRVNPDAVVLYKLGNAHYRLKQTGEAVVAYERALKRRPGFAAAAENLEIIQRSLQPDTGAERVFFIRWWKAMTRPSLSNVWAILAIIFFCGPLGLLIWSRASRKWPSWLWPYAVVSGILLSIGFALLATAAIPRAGYNTGVVMRKDAPLQTGSTAAGKGTAINLPEGLAVRVLRNEGDALRIVLPDGREGLMQAADIVVVE